MAQTQIKIVSPRGIAVYPWLNRPDTKFSADGDFKVTLKVDAAEASPLIKKLDDIISNYHEEKAKADPTYNPKPSISRASRAFKDMIDLGWIVARKDWQVWDKDQGQWLDKYYEVTELFFKALGITPERVEKNRQNRLAYHKKKGGLLGLTVSQLGNMSLSEIKTWCRLSHYRRAFERLKDKREISKAKRRTLTKTPQQQRDIAQQVVIKRLGQDLNHTPIEVFKALVNQEVAKMRSQAGYSPPDTIAS